jgi:hypothetical protein
MRPRSVNLTALWSRLTSTWRRRIGIAFDAARQAPRDRAAEASRLAARGRRHQVDRLVDERAQVEGLASAG